MPRLSSRLDLDRCPLCGVHKPSLVHAASAQTADHLGQHPRHWMMYSCQHCGGIVTAFSDQQNGEMRGMFPSGLQLDASIPSPAIDYLRQARESLSAPAGAAMLAASAVDAMLKAKGYKKGSLFERIEEAAKNHLITEDMANWAHQVRLDANEPRHADDERPLPSQQEALQGVEFADALAQFLFVLPSRVTRGIEKSKPSVG